MGIRFFCPKGHKLNVKAELAGKIGICPKCGEKMLIPLVSTRDSGEKRSSDQENRTEQFPDILSGNPGPEGFTMEATDLGKSTVNGDLSNLQSNYIEDSPLAGDNFENEEKSVRVEQVSSDADSDQEQQSSSSDNINRMPTDSTSPKFVQGTSSQMLSDPLVHWYVRAGDNQSYGPASGAIIQSWIQERRIGPSMLVWREGWSTWLEARNVFPELEAVFHSTSPEPPAISPPGSDQSGLPEVETDEPSQTITEQKKIARKKKAHRDLMIVISLIVVILFLITLLCFILFKQKSPENTSKPAVSSSVLINDCPFEKDFIS